MSPTAGSGRASMPKSAAPSSQKSYLAAPAASGDAMAIVDGASEVRADDRSTPPATSRARKRSAKASAPKRQGYVTSVPRRATAIAVFAGPPPSVTRSMSPSEVAAGMRSTTFSPTTKITGRPERAVGSVVVARYARDRNARERAGCHRMVAGHWRALKVDDRVEAELF